MTEFSSWQRLASGAAENQRGANGSNSGSLYESSSRKLFGKGFHSGREVRDIKVINIKTKDKRLTNEVRKFRRAEQKTKDKRNKTKKDDL